MFVFVILVESKVRENELQSDLLFMIFVFNQTVYSLSFFLLCNFVNDTYGLCVGLIL